MGTSRNPAQFVGKINDMATITQRVRKDVVGEGALTAKNIIIAEAAAKGVSTSSRIAGGKWGVRYDIKGSGNPAALVRITGPFHLVDRPTSPHMIYRKAARARGRGSSRINRARALAQVFGGVGAYTGGALKINGDFRKVVHHPGTRGKNIFSAAKARAGEKVPLVMSSALSSAWWRALR